MPPEEPPGDKPFKDLKTVFSHVQSVDDGKDLLALAARGKCRIFYDPTLSPHLAGLFQIAREGLEYRPWVRVNPIYPLSTQVATIVHELRHYAQDLQLDKIVMFRPETMAPLVMLAYIRIKEGDAWNFHTRVCKAISAATGITLPFDESVARNADWKETFDAFQSGPDGRAYDDNTIKECERIAVLPERKSISDMFSITSLDAVGDLRRMARRGGKPDSPIYLLDESTRDLMFSVLRHVDPSIKARARALVAKT